MKSHLKKRKTALKHNNRDSHSQALARKAFYQHKHLQVGKKVKPVEKMKLKRKTRLAEKSNNLNIMSNPCIN